MHRNNLLRILKWIYDNPDVNANHNGVWDIFKKDYGAIQFDLDISELKNNGRLTNDHHLTTLGAEVVINDGYTNEEKIRNDDLELQRRNTNASIDVSQSVIDTNRNLRWFQIISVLALLTSVLLGIKQCIQTKESIELQRQSNELQLLQKRIDSIH